MFTLEAYDYVKHMMLLTEFTPCSESLREIRASSLSKELGFTDTQVIMDSVIGSEEVWVFRSSDSRRIIGICGAAQSVVQGSIAVIPWFITNGFERDPRNTYLFLRAAREILRGWELQARGKLFVNTCLNDKRITKFLRHLGFTIEPGTGEFVTFWKKGGKSSCVQRH